MKKLLEFGFLIGFYEVLPSFEPAFYWVLLQLLKWAFSCVPSRLNRTRCAENPGKTRVGRAESGNDFRK